MYGVLRLNILLADDHALVRDGLKPFLCELDPDTTVLDAANLDEAVKIAKASDELTLILLDLKMPGMNGSRGIELLHRIRPTVPVVILSGHVEREDVLAAVRAGASGYIPKTVSGPALVNALRLVLTGESYLPSSILLDSAAVPPTNASPLSTLSPREQEILGFLIEGQTNKEIARRLDLQEITIKIHLRTASRKIGAVNRAQAVRIAMSAGWQAA